MNAKAKEEKENKKNGPTSMLLPVREESSYSAFGFIDDMK
jgi:hypothetical protein